MCTFSIQRNKIKGCHALDWSLLTVNSLTKKISMVNLLNIVTPRV